ncbi:site-specific recombinase XerD [Azospirillum baldaniorum]|uniref:site-specific integrase n=1 Tax=Azospirillum baldaniorum TaxID=1064539 RepID=UPI0011ADCF03|nr:site-specific integrase [Azospirillum baldaniorum]TWA55435.1 site-specific recombinase XerD [Azospirillum baldaniorum]
MTYPKLKFPNFNMTRRPDGYYQIRYRHDGRTKTVSTGTRDAEKAELFRAQYVADYLKPKLPEGPILKDVFDTYVEYRKPIVAAPVTFDYVFAAPRRLLGALKAETFTQSNVTEYIRRRSQEKLQGRFKGRADAPLVSEGTINKELRMVRAALNWAYAEGLLSRKPGFRIELSTGKVRDEWITKDEANRLIAASPPYLALFILIALSTAKRRSAILQLTWDRVHLDRQGYEYIDFGDDVGNKRRGTSPISGNTRLIEALKEAKRQSTSELVITWYGSSLRDVKSGLTRASKKAGIPHVSSHVLKHSAVTWMVQADVSFERIAKFTNTSKEIIQRVYGHHSPEFVSEAVKAVTF